VPTPPAKPRGGGFLKAKIGPVPVPVALAAVVAVAVYLYIRHRGTTPAQTPTSAGSNATPSAQDVASQYPAGDSTGGGAGGLDLSSLFDALSQQAAALAAAGGANTPLSDSPLYLGAAAGSTQTTGAGSVSPGGNVAPPVTATQPSTPATGFGESFVTKALGTTAAGTTGGYTNYPLLNLSNAKTGDTISTVSIPKVISGSTQYYTYKKDVKLKPGQKLKFTSGAGYYAG
jgi:hypothetical protein